MRGAVSRELLANVTFIKMIPLHNNKPKWQQAPKPKIQTKMAPSS